MPTPKNLRQKNFTVSKAVVPLITLGVLVFLWRYNLKWMTIPVIVFLLFYYLALPRIVRSQVKKFHVKAIKLLTTGKAGEVPLLVRRSLLLQLFGPGPSIDAKLGLAYVQCEEYGLAVTCFDNAIPSAPAPEQPALQSGLAKALFVTGDLARAEAEGQAVLYRVTRLPELLAIVARARVGLGKTDDETAGLLDEAEKLARTENDKLMVLLTRIEMALATGRKPAALPASADSDQRFIRAWVQLVRGLLRHKRGDDDKAKKSFAKAVELLDDSFVSAVADGYLEQLTSSESKENKPSSEGKDPAIRRKRRRRR